jgi:hypothetical protein
MVEHAAGLPELGNGDHHDLAEGSGAAQCAA